MGLHNIRINERWYFSKMKRRTNSMTKKFEQKLCLVSVIVSFIHWHITYERGWMIHIYTYFLPSFVFMLFALVSTLLCVNVILLLIQSPICFILFFSISPMISLILFSLAHSMHFASSKFANQFFLPRCTAASNINFYYCRKLFRCSEFETNSNQWFYFIVYFFSHLKKKKDPSHSIPFGIIYIYTCTCTLCIRHTISIVNCKVF